MLGSLGRDRALVWGTEAMVTPGGGHSNDGACKVEGGSDIAARTITVIPFTTGTPTQGSGWGSL